MGIRLDLASFLQGLVSGSTIVYHYPPEIPVIPAVIVVPGGEYITPLTFGPDGAAAAVVYQIELRLLVQRATPEEGFNSLEALRKEITDGLSGFNGARWIGFGDMGETTIGDIPALGGTVEIAIKTGDQI